MQFSADHPVLEQLIKGEVNHRFKSATAGMLFFNLRQKYRRNNVPIEKLKQEAVAFFTKFAPQLEEDIEALFK